MKEIQLMPTDRPQQGRWEKKYPASSLPHPLQFLTRRGRGKGKDWRTIRQMALAVV